MERETGIELLEALGFFPSAWEGEGHVIELSPGVAASPGWY